MMNKITPELCSDALKAEPEEMKKCPHCGKPFVWFNRDGKFKIHLQVPDCDCIDKIEQQKRHAEAKRLQKKNLAKRFENSMMTPLFKEKVFENLDSSKEFFSFCFNYAKKFHPKTSKGIRMIGGIGTGKTTLLAAISNELITQGYNCLFTTFAALLDKFTKHSYDNAGDITELLMWLTKFDFVVLDDIGREAYKDKRNEIAFRIIDTLLNYKVVLCVTANPEMMQKLQKMPEWAAILDRLKDVSSILLQFKGNSMRGKNV